jgi:hypothetical protein
MKRFLFVFAAVAAMLFGGDYAIAGKTQVSASAYKAAGKTGHWYGRSDGIYQEANTKGLEVIENGKPVQTLGKSYRDTFAYGDGLGVNCLDLDGVGTCVGNAALAPCLCTFDNGIKLMWLPLLQQDIAPDMDAAGLDIGADQTDNDGAELVGGIGGASGLPFIIGTDPAFYFCTTVAIADVSGTDDFHTGFRRAEAGTATFDNYNDLATIGCISGNITIETINDNAATTTTDTTDDWADAGIHKLCTYVSAAGAVTYTIDGAAPTVTAAFTFDSGDPVIPFIHYLHATTSPGAITVSLWEVGYQD